jgi:hypothetical protein
VLTVRPNGAAQESNLPTHGLHAPAGFEDRAGLAQRSGSRGVCALGCALCAAMWARPALVVVVAAIEKHEIGRPPGPADLARDRRGVQVVEQRDRMLLPHQVQCPPLRLHRCRCRRAEAPRSLRLIQHQPRCRALSSDLACALLLVLGTSPTRWTASRDRWWPVFGDDHAMSCRRMRRVPAAAKARPFQIIVTGSQVDARSIRSILQTLRRI